jgi:hypothetical protein
LAFELVDSGAQPERTALSWIRTAASVSFAALLLFRYLVEAKLEAQAFLLGGTSLLLAPLLLLAGLYRARNASKHWDLLSPVWGVATFLVSLAVGSLGIVIAVAMAIAAL